MTLHKEDLLDFRIIYSEIYGYGTRGVEFL